MSDSDFELSAHAATVLFERGIELSWVRRVLLDPERTEPDRWDVGLTHALGRIPERDDRVLRVVYNGFSDPPRIVTAYFDRRLRGKI